MADHDDLYDDLYSADDLNADAAANQDAAQGEGQKDGAADQDDFGLDDPAPSKPAAAGGSSFIPAPSSSSSTSATPKGSFIPAAPAASSASTASRSPFIPGPQSAPQASAQPAAQLPPTANQNVAQGLPSSLPSAPNKAGLPQPLGTYAPSTSSSSVAAAGSSLGPNSPEDGKMFVGGLSWDTNDEGLKQYFSQFGKVVDCNIMRDPNTGTSRGFGFLRFEDPKAVNMVMVREHMLDGKMIDPKRAIPRDTSLKSSKIFVGGIPQHTTSESFRACFAQFGPILDHNLMMDKDTGRPRGFGFVTFETEDAGRAALTSDGQVMLDGKMVDVKRATSKNAPGNDNAGGPSRPNQMQRNQQQGGMGNMGGMDMMQQAAMFNPMMMGMMGGNGMDANAMSSMFSQNGWGTGQWNPMMMQQMLMAAGAGGGGNNGMGWNPMMGQNPMMSQNSMMQGGNMGGGNRGFAAGNQRYNSQTNSNNANSSSMNTASMRQSPQYNRGGPMQMGMRQQAPAGARQSPVDGRDGRAGSMDAHKRERSPDRRGGDGSDRYESRALR